jgi:hypothetical protein
MQLVNFENKSRKRHRKRNFTFLFIASKKYISVFYKLSIRERTAKQTKELEHAR